MHRVDVTDDLTENGCMACASPRFFRITKNHIVLFTLLGIGIIATTVFELANPMFREIGGAHIVAVLFAFIACYSLHIAEANFSIGRPVAYLLVRHI